MIDYIDPIRVLLTIFEERYPEKQAQLDFVTGINKKEFLGDTCFGEDGKIYIQVCIEQTMPQLVDIVAHELAHVAAGKTAGHGAKFQEVYNYLNTEFNKRMEVIGKKRSA